MSIQCHAIHAYKRTKNNLLALAWLSIVEANVKDVIMSIPKQNALAFLSGLKISDNI